MNSKFKTFLLWFFAFIFTAALAIYQRMTGPTYPLRVTVQIGSVDTTLKLIRTWEGNYDAPIFLIVKDRSISGDLKLRRFRSHDDWSIQPMRRVGKYLVGFLPHQDIAGKVMYQVILKGGGKELLLNSEPAILRYKGAVPKYVLFPHILIVFLAMFFSTMAGLEALFKRKKVHPITWLTVICFFLGVMILGPVMQKFAFNAYWTGWPFGHDLTDNKSLLALIFWVIALVMVYRNRTHRTWVIIASVVMLVVFMIPHSILGSEIDYTKEKTVMPK